MNALMTINVDRTRHGEWEVRLPNDDGHVKCREFADAVRVGYRCAADRRGCEVVVHDAYHRVLRRELVSGELVFRQS